MLTGIKAHTLRIWEQRYNLPQPKRTATNIRYYDDEDLKLLLNVSMLNQHGHKISEITRFSEQEIRDLAISYSVHSDRHSVHLQSMMASMINLDELAFEKVLSTCILQSGLERTIFEVVFPLMSMLGAMWVTGTVNPAYEHFISSLVRQKLIVAIDGQDFQHSASQKKFLLFLPEGEHHELGLLFGNFLIRSAGHHSMYLGQNLPVGDLRMIADKYRPDYVLTSLTTGFPQVVADGFVKELQEIFPKSTLLLTGRFFMKDSPEQSTKIILIREPGDLKKVF